MVIRLSNAEGASSQRELSGVLDADDGEDSWLSSFAGVSLIVKRRPPATAGRRGFLTLQRRNLELLSMLCEHCVSIAIE